MLAAGEIVDEPVPGRRESSAEGIPSGQDSKGKKKRIEDLGVRILKRRIKNIELRMTSVECRATRIQNLASSLRYPGSGIQGRVPNFQINFRNLRCNPARIIL